MEQEAFAYNSFVNKVQQLRPFFFERYRALSACFNASLGFMGSSGLIRQTPILTVKDKTSSPSGILIWLIASRICSAVEKRESLSQSDNKIENSSPP